MKKFSSIQTVKREIDSYEKHFTGAPLVVGVDRCEDYTALLGLLKDDYSKQILRMSDTCEMDFPPDPTFQISFIGSKAKAKPAVWIGAVQAKMLYGQQSTEQFLINLLGTNLAGPVIVLCPFCCNMLEGIAHNYTKLGYNILIVNSGERNVPSIHVSSKGTIRGDGSVQGIKALLGVLEDGRFGTDIYLVTSCDISYLSSSLYPVFEGLSPYQMLCKIEPGIAANTMESNGKHEHWAKLVSDIQNAKSLSSLCLTKFGALQDLPNVFGDHLTGEEYDRFVCFVCLKVFCGNRGDYLALCLSKAEREDALEYVIYNSILEIDHGDARFSGFLRQRRRILSSLDDNNAMMKDFCERATIKGKNVLWYLGDQTEEERAALIHALCSYSYSPAELEEILTSVSPNLAAYLRRFVFDEFNTKVMASDAAIRNLLTDYFQRYKIQKLTNHQDQDFIDIVEAEAKNRSFMKLQARSAIIKKINKKGARPYFFDALGVEFLAYIQSRAEAYGMQFECSIGHCNLPSITSKNKEFYDAFPNDSVLKEEGLDEIKHHGTKFDFQFTKEPLHIFDELTVLDRDLKKMSSMLALGHCERIIIISDHGASRLAVTYRSENDKLQLAEPGKHSGRCCPSDTDPHIEFATFEDGFAVLANYDRFKGSRKADVETHGGASLEETVVPVISLTLKPKEQQAFFVETVVPCSPKDGASIRLFANPPLKQPRIVINGQSYAGSFDGDRHNVVFELRDIRRKGHHEAEVYDGGMKVTVLTFDTKRQTGTNQLL